MRAAGRYGNRHHDVCRQAPEPAVDARPCPPISTTARCRTGGEVVTGPVYLDPGGEDLRDDNATTSKPLVEMAYEDPVPEASNWTR